jgi:hypothetical protein
MVKAFPKQSVEEAGTETAEETQPWISMLSPLPICILNPSHLPCSFNIGKEELKGIGTAKPR